MKDLKKPLTYEEQFNKLVSHHMQCEDKDLVIKVLKTKNYYRFTGYALQQRISPHDSNYKEDTTFQNIYGLYLFDQSMRDVLRKYIEIVEIYYRTQISYGFAITKCTQPPYDQHYDETNFYNKEGYNFVMDNFNHDKKYYTDSLIMKHHKGKYDNRLPLWAMVEMMSFSNLSKLYSSMYESEQKYIATEVGTGSKMLKNNLHCLSVLRNKCAHGARLYNTTFNPPVKFNDAFLRKHPEIKTDTLFAYVLVLLKRLPDTECKRSFITSVLSVMENFEEYIDLKLIGFPIDYKTILESSI